MSPMRPAFASSLTDEELVTLALSTRDRMRFHAHLAAEAEADYVPLRLEVARRGLWRAMMAETSENPT